MKRPNHAIERTADPRHASCVRTCRAAGRGPLIAIVGAGGGDLTSGHNVIT